MNLKMCLLVTDDPDDHQAIAEAIAEISSSTVLVTISDSKKAIALLKQKKFVPDYLVVDLSMHGIQPNDFLDQLDADSTLGAVTVVYGEEPELFKAKNIDDRVFFNKDYTYSQLRSFLTRIVRD